MPLASAAEPNIGMAAMTPANALPPALLEVSGLTVSRGGRTLFASLDLRLAASETLLIRGPNGVGKSSLLLALAGILRPETGSIRWTGPEEAPQIHLLAHSNGVKPRLTLSENLDFWSRLNGPGGLATAAALERVGLGTLGGIEAGHLSAGQTRRLTLARLLVSQRKIWLLDEPTAALDAAGHGLVGEMLAEHAASGGGAIVATHDDIPLTEAAGVRVLA
jgi:heme exporter protein A